MAEPLTGEELAHQRTLKPDTTGNVDRGRWLATIAKLDRECWENAEIQDQILDETKAERDQADRALDKLVEVQAGHHAETAQLRRENVAATLEAVETGTQLLKDLAEARTAALELHKVAMGPSRLGTATIGRVGVLIDKWRGATNV